MTARTASCRGRLTATVTDEPVRVSVCHYLDKHDWVEILGDEVEHLD